MGLSMWGSDWDWVNLRMVCLSSLDKSKELFDKWAVSLVEPSLVLNQSVVEMH